MIKQIQAMKDKSKFKQLIQTSKKKNKKKTEIDREKKESLPL